MGKEVQDLPGGGQVVSYDSYEELMEDQRKAHEAAMANMTPSQRAIPLGGYAVNLSGVPDHSPIYGAIKSPAEERAWHRLHYGVGDERDLAVLAERGIFQPPRTIGDPADQSWKEDGFATATEAIDYYVESLIERWTNGYLTGFWSSDWEPRGELGDAHASVCVQIDEETYRDGFEHAGFCSEANAVKIAAAIAVVRQETRAREGTTEGGGDVSDG